MHNQPFLTVYGLSKMPHCTGNACENPTQEFYVLRKLWNISYLIGFIVRKFYSNLMGNCMTIVSLLCCISIIL